jgi:Coenzyme PQQ synthesis protein D (PqqD)
MTSAAPADDPMVAAGELVAPSALLAARVRIPQTVVYRSFVHETVLLNLETGLYHGTNPVGGTMLDTLSTAGSVQQAAERLAGQYGVPLDEIESDLCSFCAELAERGLLTVEFP